MERTINVTGKAGISVKPDRVEILINLSGTNEDYGKTVALSEEMTGALRSCFSALGFDEKDLKTVNFSVNTKYENYTDENGRYRQRFCGYEFEHSLKIAFEAAGNNLERAIAALSNCPSKPEFKIVYTVKDKESAKNELLKKSVENSAQKAAVLAAAAGVTLGDIIRIDYSWRDIPMEIHPMEGAMCLKGAVAANLDIVPEDIEITDSVTVMWEIK